MNFNCNNACKNLSSNQFAVFSTQSAVISPQSAYLNTQSAVGSQQSDRMPLTDLLINFYQQLL